MSFDGLRVGGVELVFKKLPISGIWGYPVQNSRARGHAGRERLNLVRHGKEARRRGALHREPPLKGLTLVVSFKLVGARSRLYQHRFLQLNTYFAAFFRIFKMVPVVFLKKKKKKKRKKRKREIKMS